MIESRIVSTIAHLCAAVCLVCGCGEDTGATAPDAGAGVSEISKAKVPDHGGFTDTEIHLGMSAAFTMRTRALGIELYRGSMAYFSYVNEKGIDGTGQTPGIHGRKIVLKAYDDHYEPDPVIKNTLKLINEDNVFTLIDYVGTPTMNRTLPLLSKNRDRGFILFFPFTGAGTNRSPPYDRYSFNLRASYAQETEGLVNHFIAIGRRRIAVYYQADAYGRAGWAGVIDAIDKANEGQAHAAPKAEMAGEATYRRGTPYADSYDRQVALMQRFEPDAVIAIGAYAACAGFIRDMRHRGLMMPIANVSFVGSEAMLDLLSKESEKDGKDYTRFLVNSQVVPSYHDETIEAVREYRERMRQYADRIMPPESLMYPEGKTQADAYTPLPYSFVSLEGFLNAKLMAKILDAMGPALDRHKIEQAVMSLHDVDLGLGETISFGPQKRQGEDKVFYTVVKDGRFVSFDDKDWKEWEKK